MALEYIVNEDFEITITQEGAAVPGSTSIGKDDLTVAISSSKVKADGVSVMKGPVLNFAVPAQSTILGCLGPGTTGEYTIAGPPVSGAGMTMTAGSEKVKAENLLVFLKGDTATCNCVGIDTAPIKVPPTIPPTTAFSGKCKFEITNAGQTKVKAE